jgi:hypothetical protein
VSTRAAELAGGLRRANSSSSPTIAPVHDVFLVMAVAWLESWPRTVSL